MRSEGEHLTRDWLGGHGTYMSMDSMNRFVKCMRDAAARGRMGPTRLACGLRGLIDGPASCERTGDTGRGRVP